MRRRHRRNRRCISPLRYWAIPNDTAAHRSRARICSRTPPAGYRNRPPPASPRLRHCSGYPRPQGRSARRQNRLRGLRAVSAGMVAISPGSAPGTGPSCRAGIPAGRRPCRSPLRRAGLSPRRCRCSGFSHGCAGTGRTPPPASPAGENRRYSCRARSAGGDLPAGGPARRTFSRPWDQAPAVSWPCSRFAASRAAATIP